MEICRGPCDHPCTPDSFPTHLLALSRPLQGTTIHRTQDAVTKARMAPSAPGIAAIHFFKSTASRVHAAILCG